ncbi:stage II sporulation protein M [Bacillus sp. A015]
MKILRSLHLNNFSIIISLIVFLIGITLGLFTTPTTYKSVTPIETSSNMLELIKNNLFVCLLLISGFFSCGLITLFYLFSNGYIISVSILESVNNGLSPIQISLYILPHGIFEIPALLISGSIGFMGLKIIFELCFSDKKNIFTNNLRKIIINFILIIVLIVIAAFIESYISPLLTL